MSEFLVRESNSENSKRDDKKKEDHAVDNSTNKEVKEQAGRRDTDNK